VQGNGQTELVEAIMGLRPVASGTASLLGLDLVGRSTKNILRAGVSYIPEDRTVDGLVRTFTVAENLILNQSDQAPFARGLALRPAAIERSARERIAEFDVRTSSPYTLVGTLSGGNQQKVIVARELGRSSPGGSGQGGGHRQRLLARLGRGELLPGVKLLIAAQPTRGVDVGSTEFIHARMIRERDNGVAVLLISSELDEILALADRIAVMYRGRILATLPADTPRERIGLLMAGVTE
jgi:simple sugar transport system ATP-binding protein